MGGMTFIINFIISSNDWGNFMQDRITLISKISKEDFQKLNYYINELPNNLCKVPYGKKVKNRYEADTLPYHFTIFSWSIQKEEELIEYLNEFTFQPIKVLVEDIRVVSGAEESYQLRFTLKKTKELYAIQRNITKRFPSTFYNPNNYSFHITIHITKDYNEIVAMQNKLKQSFTPFSITINCLELYKIYPAQLLKRINAY